MGLDDALDDGETDAVAARAGREERLENALANGRGYAGTVVAHHDLGAPAGRAAREQLQLEICAGGLQRVGGEIQHRGDQRRRVGAHRESRRLGADGQAHAPAQRRAQPLRHLLEQRAHAHHLAGGAAVRERQHVVDQLIQLLQARDRFSEQRARSSGARPGHGHLRGVQQRGGQRRADLVCESRGQLPMVTSRCWRARNTFIKCDSVTSASSTTSRPRRRSRLDTLTNRPVRARCARRWRRAFTAARASTAAKRWPSKGSPSSATRRRIALLDLAVGIEHQHAAGQSLDQGRQPRGEMLLAGVRLAELVAQLAPLGARSASKAPESCSETEPKARNAACSSLR